MLCVSRDRNWHHLCSHSSIWRMKNKFNSRLNYYTDHQSLGVDRLALCTGYLPSTIISNLLRPNYDVTWWWWCCVFGATQTQVPIYSASGDEIKETDPVPTLHLSWLGLSIEYHHFKIWSLLSRLMRYESGEWMSIHLRVKRQNQKRGTKNWLLHFWRAPHRRIQFLLHHCTLYLTSTVRLFAFNGMYQVHE